jgi:hypothetical protein
MGRDAAFGRERQARLKQEYAAAYEGIAPGVWQPAWLLAEQLEHLPSRSTATGAERLFDPRHFEFRGGRGRPPELRGLRSRVSDQGD